MTEFFIVHNKYCVTGYGPFPTHAAANAFRVKLAEVEEDDLADYYITRVLSANLPD